MSVHWINGAADGSNISMSFVAADSPSYEEVYPRQVATPRGTPSPPNAASTVARPNKRPSIRIEDLESSLEHLSKWKALAVEDTASSSKAEDGDDTSLGLLPADTVANCTLSATTNIQNTGIADPSRSAIFGFSRLQPPTPENMEHPHISEGLLSSKLTTLTSPSSKEDDAYLEDYEDRQIPSRPSSTLSNQQNEYKDDSAETVIRKPSPRDSPCLMMFSPVADERNQTPISSPSPSSNMVILSRPNHQEHDNMADIDHKEFINSSETVECNGGVDIDFDFTSAPPQNFGDALDISEAFTSIHANNTKYIDAEERDNEEKFRFLQEENMNVTNESCHQNQDIWAGWSEEFPHSESAHEQTKEAVSEMASDGYPNKENQEDVTTNSSEPAPNNSYVGSSTNSSGLPSTSLSLESGVLEYFRKGTSRIGESLDDRSSQSTTSSIHQIRPNFGFDLINSPKRRPVAAIEPEKVDQSENRDPPENTSTTLNKTEVTTSIMEAQNEGKKSNEENEDVHEVEVPQQNVYTNFDPIPVYPADKESIEPIPVHPLDTESNNLVEGMVDIYGSKDYVTKEQVSFLPDDRIFGKSGSPNSTTLPTMQQSIRQTLLEETGISADDCTITKVITEATPGHDAKYYALLVLKEMSKVNGGSQVNEQTITNYSFSLLSEKSTLDSSSLTSWLPSFLEESSELERDNPLKKNVKLKKDKEAKRKDIEQRASPNVSTDHIANKGAINATKKLSKLKVQHSTNYRHSSPIKKPQSKMNDRQLKENVNRAANRIQDLSNMPQIESEKVGVSKFINPEEADNAIPELPKHMMADVVFPIQSDKAVMNWFSTLIDDHGEDQLLTLHNILNTDSLRVRLIIRECNDFVFKENTLKGFEKSPHFLDIILPPNGTKDVYVTYHPIKAGVHSRGKLIVKPQTNASNKTVKASIVLTGYSGCSKIEFQCPNQRQSNCIKLISGRKTSLTGHFGDSGMTIFVHNCGEAAGFVKLVAFSDPDLKISVPINKSTSQRNPSLIVRNQDMVLVPGQTDSITIKHASIKHGFQPDRMINVVLFHGSELHRQAFCIAKSTQPYDGISPDMILGQDFTSIKSPLSFFEAGDSNISVHNAKTFFEKLQRTDFSVRFSALNKQFYNLMPEETLDESKIWASSESPNQEAISLAPALSRTGTRTMVEKQRKEDCRSVVEDNQLRSELELAIQTPGSQVTVLQNASCKEPKGIHSKREQGDFSVVVASKPRFPSENNVESDRQLTAREVDRAAYRNKREDVFLERTAIYFPTVLLDGSCVAKVTIKNRTKKSVHFSLNSLSAPFTNYHTTVEVKPRYYLNIPIMYSPKLNDLPGPHECFLNLKDNVSGKVLVARLVGRRQ